MKSRSQVFCKRFAVRQMPGYSGYFRFTNMEGSSAFCCPGFAAVERRVLAL